MNVFVTGATGVHGKRVVRLLVERGDEVSAAARSDSNVAAIEALGARPVRGDIFDTDFVHKATVGCDAIAHLATKIPRVSKAVRKKTWAENDNIRAVATPLLVDAAIANGVETVIFPSVHFAYEDRGNDWIDESVPWVRSGMWEGTAKAEDEMARFAATGGRGVVLRNGLFYAPDASSTDDTRSAARLGFAPTLGPAQGYHTSLWLDDAATAVVAALGVPSGTYNVCEDEPLTRADYCVAVAAALGKAKLRPVPTLLAKLAGIGHLTSSQRVSNTKFKDATGWAPQMRSARDGWAEIGRAERIRNAS